MKSAGSFGKIKELRNLANWQEHENKPTWHSVTSRELADILGVTIQDINNWLIRNKLPKPEPRKKGQGNKNRFMIAKVKALFEGKDEDQIHWEWIEKNLPDYKFESISQAQYLISKCPAVLRHNSSNISNMRNN